MRWPIFVLFVYITLACQLGLAGALSIEGMGTTFEPRFVLLLAVFIGLNARPRIAMMSWGIIGLLIDLTTQYTEGLVLVGPYTLGYLAGGYFLSHFKAMLFPRHPMSFAIGTLVSGIAVHLIVTGIFAVRVWYEPLPGWSGKEELVMRMGAVLYTMVLAFVLSIPIHQLIPMFNFQIPKRPNMRR